MHGDDIVSGQQGYPANAYTAALDAVNGQGPQGTPTSAQDRARPKPGFYTSEGQFLGPLPEDDTTFTPDQSDLRQLLIVKLRALATDLDVEGFKRPHAGEIRQRVARLQAIAGELK